MRRPHRAPPSVKEGPRINDEIQVPEVQLIDHEGDNHGIVPIEEARDIAEDAGLDLVEISPNTKPPVCKILDYGRFKYLSQKKAAEARKKQKTVDVKEIKMRPNIDTHDYDVKMRNAVRFLADEDKVKVTMRFRGREMAHQELGLEVLYKVRDDLSALTKVEFEPKLEGRQMTMILAPLPAKPGARKAKLKAAAAAATPDQAENEAPDQATGDVVEEPAEETVAPDQAASGMPSETAEETVAPDQVASEAPDQSTGETVEESAEETVEETVAAVAGEA